MALSSQYMEVNFGGAYSGLATVGYELLDGTGATVVARTTTGVFELATGSGVYGVVVPAIANNVTSILWDTGGGTPVYASEDLEPLHQLGAILFTGSTGPWTTATGFAVAGDAMDLVTDAVDADAVATSGAQEIRDEILSDSTPFQGADIPLILADTAAMQPLVDVAISTRATQADILSDATPFAGANVDAAISSRSDFDETTDPVELLDLGGTAGTSAAELVVDVEAKLATDHGSGQWDDVATQAEIQAAMTAQGYTTARAPLLDNLDAAVSTRATQAQILSDATPFQGADVGEILADTAAMQPLVDVAVSTRSDFDETTDPVELLDTGGAAGTSAAELVTDIETDLSANHGSGQWDATATGIVADVQTGLTNQGYTTGRAPNLDNLDALVSSRSDFDETTDPVELLDSGGAAGTSADELVTDIGTDLSGTHGAGSWEGDSAATIDAELTANHGAGSWKGIAFGPCAVTAEVDSDAVTAEVEDVEVTAEVECP